MQAKEVPTPQISCRPDGKHWSVCPDCGLEFEVVVTDHQHPDHTFAVKAEYDEALDQWRATEVVPASHTTYSTSEFEAHYREVH